VPKALTSKPRAAKRPTRNGAAAGAVEGAASSEPAVSSRRRAKASPGRPARGSPSPGHREPDRSVAGTGARMPPVRLRRRPALMARHHRPDPERRAIRIAAAGGGAAAAVAGPMAAEDRVGSVAQARRRHPQPDVGPWIGRNRMNRQGVGMSSDFSLFERHVDGLYRSALRLTRKPEDAEDLVQETYLRAYRYRNRFKPGTNEKAWLFTIMTNAFRNRIRQRMVVEAPIDEPGTDFSIYDQLRREGMPVHLMSPEEIIVDRGFGDEVKRALEELPVPMRMVVILVDVEDFSYKDVAAILGIKIGTVMSRLHRGRQALQKKLWEYSGRPKAPSLAVGAH
jgi:RNA polymerase sigma-70 factor, ECF subfamily